MTQNPEKYDVAVAGGGMVGMTLALALARENLHVAVIDPVPAEAQAETTFDGRVSAIALTSKRLLTALGAWQYMEPHAEPILDIRVSDGDSPFFLHYDHHEVGAGPFGWIVENRYIRTGLAHAARTLPIDRIQGETQGWQPGMFTLKDGRTIEAKLLIGADGKQSQVREFAGIRVAEACYRQIAIVCTIAHEKPHQGLAQERFLPAGPFAVLPMQNNQSSLVWTEAAEHARGFLALPEAEFIQEITERVGDYLGALRTVGPRFSYPLSVSHAADYTAPRLALVGDAAHAIHPIAGQGVNLGFRDVAALADIVARHAHAGRDIGSDEVLKAYQRWRRFDNLAMLAVTDGLNRLFSTGAPPLVLARGLGLWAISHLPPAKRFFMRHAMGLTGELPPLLREAA